MGGCFWWLDAWVLGRFGRETWRTMDGGVWAAETRGEGDRSSLSLAGDPCWPTTAPGGRSPVRERAR